MAGVTSARDDSLSRPSVRESTCPQPESSCISGSPRLGERRERARRISRAAVSRLARSSPSPPPAGKQPTSSSSCICRGSSDGCGSSISARHSRGTLASRPGLCSSEVTEQRCWSARKLPSSAGSSTPPSAASAAQRRRSASSQLEQTRSCSPISSALPSRKSSSPSGSAAPCRTSTLPILRMAFASTSTTTRGATTERSKSRSSPPAHARSSLTRSGTSATVSASLHAGRLSDAHEVEAASLLRSCCRRSSPSPPPPSGEAPRQASTNAAMQSLCMWLSRLGGSCDRKAGSRPHTPSSAASAPAERRPTAASPRPICPLGSSSSKVEAPPPPPPPSPMPSPPPSPLSERTSASSSSSCASASAPCAFAAPPSRAAAPSARLAATPGAPGGIGMSLSALSPVAPTAARSSRARSANQRRVWYCLEGLAAAASTPDGVSESEQGERRGEPMRGGTSSVATAKAGPPPGARSSTDGWRLHRPRARACLDWDAQPATRLRLARPPPRATRKAAATSAAAGAVVLACTCRVATSCDRSSRRNSACSAAVLAALPAEERKPAPPPTPPASRAASLAMADDSSSQSRCHTSPQHAQCGTRPRASSSSANVAQMAAGCSCSADERVATGRSIPTSASTLPAPSRAPRVSDMARSSHGRHVDCAPPAAGWKGAPAAPPPAASAAAAGPSRASSQLEAPGTWAGCGSRCRFAAGEGTRCRCPEGEGASAGAGVRAGGG